MSTNKKTIIVFMSILLLIIIFVFGKLSKSSNVKSDMVVNVYSTRDYEADKIVYDAFEKVTGIRVNLVTGKFSELLERLDREGKDTEADLFFTSDIANFDKVIDENLIKPIVSEQINKNVAKNLREKDNKWIAITVRAKAIVFDKQVVKPKEISTLKELANDKWEGQIVTRTSDSIYTQLLLSSMIERYGETEAKDWARKIVGNFAKIPGGNDKDQIKSIYNGVGSIAIISAHNVGCMLNSQDLEDRENIENIGVVIPKDTSKSASGIALSKFSENEENAIKLVEFMLSEKAQQTFTDYNYEYPVNSNVAVNSTLLSWGDIDIKNIDLENFNKNNIKSKSILKEVGW